MSVPIWAFKSQSKNKKIVRWYFPDSPQGLGRIASFSCSFLAEVLPYGRVAEYYLQWLVLGFHWSQPRWSWSISFQLKPNHLLHAYSVAVLLLVLLPRLRCISFDRGRYQSIVVGLSFILYLRSIPVYNAMLLNSNDVIIVFAGSFSKFLSSMICTKSFC